MTKIADLSAAQMVAVFNHYADKPVAKFASAAIGRARLVKLLAGIDAPECKAIAAVLAPAPAEAPTPIDILGEAAALRAGADRIEAARKGKAAKAPAKAKAAAKPAKAPAKAPAPAEAPKYRGIWADAAEAAARGKMPPAPDFSANTHTQHRAKLAKLVAMAKAGDIAGLRAIVINPVSSSPKAMARYRDLAVVALEAKAGR